MNDELYHYGIKGMRWGIRKDKKNKKNKVSNPYKKVKIGKVSANNTLKIVGALGITAIGIYAVPKLQNILGRKIYARQLVNDVIDFDNLGPEIVRRIV